VSSQIFNDEFFAGLSSSVGDVTDAETLPPECYTDEGFFEFEKEALFNHEWLCVGREDWVKSPGDYFTTSHIGEPIIVVRTREGALKAMSASASIARCWSPRGTATRAVSSAPIITGPIVSTASSSARRR